MGNDHFGSMIPQYLCEEAIAIKRFSDKSPIFSDVYKNTDPAVCA